MILIAKLNTHTHENQLLCNKTLFYTQSVKPYWDHLPHIIYYNPGNTLHMQSAAVKSAQVPLLQVNMFSVVSQKSIMLWKYCL